MKIIKKKNKNVCAIIPSIRLFLIYINIYLHLNEKFQMDGYSSDCIPIQLKIKNFYYKNNSK